MGQGRQIRICMEEGDLAHDLPIMGAKLLENRPTIGGQDLKDPNISSA